jgi:hypothetical protein
MLRQTLNAETEVISLGSNLRWVIAKKVQTVTMSEIAAKY